MRSLQYSQRTWRLHLFRCVVVSFKLSPISNITNMVRTNMRSLQYGRRTWRLHRFRCVVVRFKLPSISMSSIWKKSQNAIILFLHIPKKFQVITSVRKNLIYRKENQKAKLSLFYLLWHHANLGHVKIDVKRKNVNYLDVNLAIQALKRLQIFLNCFQNLKIMASLIF